MKEEGIVKTVKGDTCEAVVRRKTACGDNCASCKGACRMQFQTVKVKNNVGAKAGDTVEIEMENKKVFLSAFFVYILPLLVFITVYGVGEKIFFNSIKTVVISALCFLFSFLPALIYDRRKKEEFLPVITKILDI